jgi:hypothetical protein
MDKSLAELLIEFDDHHRFIGSLLVGSAARGDSCSYSDLDLIFFTREEPSEQRLKYQLKQRNGRLISLSQRSLDAVRTSLADPIPAIQTVQGLRDSVVLRDSKSLDLTELKVAAKRFQWTPQLKMRAHQEASYQLMGYAEEVGKILRGMSTNDDMALLNGVLGLSLSMPLVIALKQGILSRGENLFRAQVCRTLGTDSRWAVSHAIAIGARPGPAGYSPLQQQAIGAFWLYEETVHLSTEIILPEDAEVIRFVLRTARQSGLLPRQENPLISG